MTFSTIMIYIIGNTIIWVCIHIAVSKFFLSLSQNSLKVLYRPLIPSLPIPKSVKRRFYESILRIRLWKDKIPYGTQILGLGKSPLSSFKRSQQDHFVLETVRAEWTHWITLLMAPLFLFINPISWFWVHALYAIVSNIPCILIQRYNRLRINKLI